MDVVLDFRDKYTEVAKHLKITITDGISSVSQFMNFGQTTLVHNFAVSIHTFGLMLRY